MPTYEYECTKGHRFEVVQRISEPPLKRCRECRSRVQRLIQPAAFILKGGGWHADGYSSKGGSSAGAEPSDAKSSDSSESASPSSASSKGDSKSSGSGSSPASDS
jgi:putative FmdB family regulatory protein